MALKKTKAKVQAQAQLGDLIKDEISEVTGKVVWKTEWIQGCTRLGMQPKAKRGEKEALEPIAVDSLQTKVLKKGVLKVAKPNAYTVGLGDEVEDNITGVKGICEAIVTHLDGGVMMGIQPKKKKTEQKSVKLQFVHCIHIKIIKKNAYPAKPKGPEGPQQDFKRTTNF